MRAIPSPTDMIVPTLANVDGTLVILDLVPQNTCNLVCPYLSHKIPVYPKKQPVTRGFSRVSPLLVPQCETLSHLG